MTRREKAVSSSAIVLVAAWTFVVLWSKSEAESLDKAGLKILRAIVRRDGAFLSGYMLPAEREQVKQGKGVDELLKLVVPPGLVESNHAFLPMYSNSALSCALFVRGIDGVEGKFEVVVHSTDDGPRALIIGSIIMDSWQLRFGAQYVKQSERFRAWKSILDGLQTMGDDIEALGISGFREDDGRFVKWKDLKEFAHKMCEGMKKA